MSKTTSPVAVAIAFTGRALSSTGAPFESTANLYPALGRLRTVRLRDCRTTRCTKSEAILTDALEQIRGNGEKVLFIMDDVVNDMKKEARLEKLLCKVLMNRRHVCGAGGSLSVWITTQVYNKVPAPVRKCASHLILYETKNRMELDSLFNEVIVGMTKMEWYQLCKYVWDKRYNFMYLDTTKSFNQMYHKLFNQLHLTTEMDEKMRESEDLL